MVTIKSAYLVKGAPCSVCRSYSDGPALLIDFSFGGTQGKTAPTFGVCDGCKEVLPVIVATWNAMARAGEQPRAVAT